MPWRSPTDQESADGRLLGLSALPLETHYASSRGNLVEDFYKPCIERSMNYDRAVGSFSTGMMSLVQRPIAIFARNGGRIRLVCSHQLSKQDISSIEQGYDWREIADNSIANYIEQVLSDPEGLAVLTFVSSLIAAGALDIQIAFRPNTVGVFHQKLGLFNDRAGNSVSFVGSINESWAAWGPNGNYESFEVFTSWGPDHERVARHVSDFTRLWENGEPTLEVIPFPQVAKDKLGVIESERDPLLAYDNYIRSTKEREPRNNKLPLSHQVDAIDAWRKNGCRGILKHATGSGKTLSAILALREWLLTSGPAIVVVPSTLLLDQWYQEISNELADLRIQPVRASGKHPRWRQLGAIESLTSADSGNQSVIIATLPTAVQRDFRNRIQGGNHLLLIWDEVHWAGARVNSELLSLDTGGRLGLSATPERYHDLEGTRKIFDYFGGVVHEFSLGQAIAAGRLVPYNYYVHPVDLNESEKEQWQVLTRQIIRGFARLKSREPHEPGINDSVENLLFRRSRIVKRAEGKIGLAGDILKDSYAEGDRWLVYCEDREQLEGIISELRKRGLECSEYHSYMESDRQATIERLEGIGGILVAIRCLDEGVDLPAVTHALILASSKNPREFIQRRGRVLRSSPGKNVAYIHDAIVVPQKLSNDVCSFDDRNIIRGEIARALLFAEESSNPSEILRLRNIASMMGIHTLDLEAASDSNDDVLSTQEE